MENEIIMQHRAWTEIDLNNLQNNIEQIKSVIPKECKIMAVVKANAYGHGMIEVSTKLNEIGIEDFAVATLSEAIILRENSIKGNILILGYTPLEDIKYIKQYNLIQTIVDYEYAKKVEELKLDYKLKVHIKINTGMNRIGEHYKNLDNLIKIYEMKNLEILGTYSHLCVADSLEDKDIDFTTNQIDNFFSSVKKIKESGHNVGKVHIQASYGILNYPNLQCDFVRPGIIMYGAYNDCEPKIKINIKPVLSLKAIVTSVKQITEGESVSYGRVFVANTNKKIATVSIGYGDGYPRSLSNKNAKVFVNGEYAEVIGRICMDQLMIDVTSIKNVNPGDVVELIGKQIPVESVASKADTNTNELLCRLRDRLGRIIK